MKGFGEVEHKHAEETWSNHRMQCGPTMFPWRCFILPAGLMTWVKHIQIWSFHSRCTSMWFIVYMTRHVSESLCLFSFAFHSPRVSQFVSIWCVMSICSSIWGTGRIGRSGTSVTLVTGREKIFAARHPAGGIWFRFAWSPCRKVKKYTLTIIVIFRMFFLLGGSLLTIHLPQRRHQTMFYLPNRKGCVRYIQVVKKNKWYCDALLCQHALPSVPWYEYWNVYISVWIHQQNSPDMSKGKLRSMGFLRALAVFAVSIVQGKHSRLRMFQVSRPQLLAKTD